MTIKETYDMFIRNRSVYCSPETLRSYKGHLKVFFDFWKLQAEKASRSFRLMTLMMPRFLVISLFTCAGRM